MTRTKVFVGNLSFKTKREDLASEFGAAGKVVEANIITRGTRSLGYGFVEMESEEDAQKAITIMNKKPIDSREINVELAKPRDESKVAERRSSSSSGGNAGGNGGNGNNAQNRRPRRRFRRGGSSNDSPSTGRNNQEGGSQNNNNNNNQRSGGGKRASTGDNKESGRNNNNNNNNSSSSNNNADGGDKSAPGNRRFRNRRFRRSRFPRKDLPQRKETETSLFVANLPFSVDNQALSELYKQYNVKSAHVVVNRNGKSKGFGFVELASQADQKAALEGTNKSKVEGRELIVKIALTPIEEHKDSSAPSSQSDSSSNEPAKDEKKN